MFGSVSDIQEINTYLSHLKTTILTDPRGNGKTYPPVFTYYTGKTRNNYFLLAHLIYSTNIATWQVFKQKLDNLLLMPSQMYKSHTESPSKLQMTRPHSPEILS